MRSHPRAGNPEGEVLVPQWPNMDEEALGIARIIRKRIENQEVEPGGVLVLAPRRQFGYKVRDALQALGVNAHSFFHEQALDEEEAKQAFALLTLLANPDDRVALRCWCGFGSPSMRKNAWARLRSHCRSSGRIAMGCVDQTRGRQLDHPPHGTADREIEGIRGASSASLSASTFARPSACGRHLPRQLASGQAPSAPWFTRQCKEARSMRNNSTRACARGITQPELPTDVDYVRVMSLHKSKGLTADLVAVVGCVEGLVPRLEGDSPEEQDAKLEEQRRLFYVAVTRTTRVLILSSVKKFATTARLQHGCGGSRPEFLLLPRLSITVSAGAWSHTARRGSGIDPTLERTDASGAGQVFARAIQSNSLCSGY